MTIWEKLRAPIPAEHISQREGHGGKMLDYIDRPVVWDRLDSLADGEWTAAYRPLAPMNGPEPYAMICELTVNGITREGVGEGKDWKEAETDAFKRAAVHFGIGRQLYGTVGESKPTPQKAAAPSRSQPSPPRSTSTPSASGVPACPKCSGPMWDNRVNKKNPKGPDFKCKDKGCVDDKGFGTALWLPKDDVDADAPYEPEAGMPF